MKCHKCGGTTLVIDTRPLAQDTVKRRRRGCQSTSCGHRFTTYEGATIAGNDDPRVLAAYERGQKDGENNAIKEAKLLRETPLWVRAVDVIDTFITALRIQLLLEREAVREALKKEGKTR